MNAWRPYGWLALLARAAPVVALACALGCSSAADDRDVTPALAAQPPSGVVWLSPSEQLWRHSVALRGQRPSEEELLRVEQEPSAMPELIGAYVSSEGFYQLVREVFNEAFLFRVSAATFPAGFASAGVLAQEEVQRINGSVTEAPLRLIEHVVRTDRPFSEIVTADYAVVDGPASMVWGLPYTGNGSSWQVARYTDGRPTAGVLSDGWLYTRFSSTFSNKNRGRANAVSRALLCEDFLERHAEADTDVDLTDLATVENSIRDNAACVSCHQTLDPLASHFGDFYPLYVPSFLTAYPFEMYTPEQRAFFTVSDPRYFGFPSGTVKDLGRMVALDPRFSLCIAKRFVAYLEQRPLGQVSWESVRDAEQVLRSTQSIKELAKAIVLSDAFKVSHVTQPEGSGGVGEPAPTSEPAPSASLPLGKGLYKLRPWQLARRVEELTGFRWQAQLDFDLGYGKIGGVELLKDSLFGFEALFGGIDSVNVTLPSHTMNATAAIVLDALARAAAGKVVEDDFKFPNSTKLLGGVTHGTREEGFVKAKLAELEQLALGPQAKADPEALEDLYALFNASLSENNDVKQAWKATLYALFQDPRFLFY